MKNSSTVRRDLRESIGIQTGIDEYDNADSSEVSDKSSESGQESPRRRAGQESTRRREVVKRVAEDRKERQEWDNFKHAQTKRSAKDSGTRGNNDTAPRTKRTVQDLVGPTSPETIRKAARINWNILKPRMRKHTAS